MCLQTYPPHRSLAQEEIHRYLANDDLNASGPSACAALRHLRSQLSANAREIGQALRTNEVPPRDLVLLAWRLMRDASSSSSPEAAIESATCLGELGVGAGPALLSRVSDVPSTYECGPRAMLRIQANILRRLDRLLIDRDVAVVAAAHVVAREVLRGAVAAEVWNDLGALTTECLQVHRPSRASPPPPPASSAPRCSLASLGLLPLACWRVDPTASADVLAVRPPIVSASYEDWICCVSASLGESFLQFPHLEISFFPQRLSRPL